MNPLDAIAQFLTGDRFLPLFLVAWLFGAIVTVAVFVVRRKKMTWFARAPSDAIFVERRTSGTSLRNALTRVGGARGSLLVAIGPSDLVVRPHFPFSLLTVFDIYGLGQSIPRSRLKGAKLSRPLFFRKRIVVEFLNGQGVTEAIELLLRSPDDFIAALRQLGVPVTDLEPVSRSSPRT